MGNCHVSAAPGAASPYSRGPDSHLGVHVCTHAHTPLFWGQKPQSRCWGTRPAHLRVPGKQRCCRKGGRQAGTWRGRHLELVRPQLVDVGAGSRLWLVPKAELEEQLVPPGQQHLAPLLSELQVLLRAWWFGHGSQEVPRPHRCVPQADGGSPQHRAEPEPASGELCRVDANIPCCF